MNNSEIRKKISENNKLIEYLMTPDVFTLNNTIAELLAENVELQKQCSHQFVDGYCSFCDKMEEK